MDELKERIGNITVGFTYDGEPVRVHHWAIGCHFRLVERCLKPNLVQTAEGTPAIVHGGPFANIAQGANSILATKTACGFPSTLSPKRALALIWERRNS
jgi:formate--tetrahydrofolate ligase